MTTFVTTLSPSDRLIAEQACRDLVSRAAQMVDSLDFQGFADAFAPDGDELERLMYGFSLFVCLPDGLSSPPSVGTGTVMRPSTLRGYALDAGFESMEVLPIEGFGFWRFYLLR